ncbi:monocarboxylate transporter 14-like isoform X1 [Onthophagus taurus]|uniref:monocarboxylate transporter 14-like isoform X1 n=1 Tax=Onthophagus taurus TaxID=166361 RepID=UPI0039BDFBCE
MHSTKRKVVPDGGYGWIIMIAYALHHFVSIPIMQGFGLMYKDTFQDLGFTATDSALILNTNAAFMMLCGIINGPLLKQLGYRKVSICGAFLTTVGVLLTSRATNFTHFMIAYGLITSLGMGMGMSSYPVALNTYFTTKRSKAAGYTMTIAGLGPVVMPQLISFLLYMYGVRGACMVLGAVAGHTFISAILLQPVKWHMKQIEDENNELNEIIEEKTDNDRSKSRLSSRRNSSESINDEIEIEAIYGIDTPLAGSLMSLAEKERNQSISSRRRFSLSKSKESLAKSKIREINELSEEEAPLQLTSNGGKVYNPEQTIEKKKKPSLLKRIGKNIVDTFDLKLLKDPIYVNIMLGMSLAVFAELNFSLLTPFIMGDYDFTTQQTATFMSLLSCADICFRFLAPYIGDVLKKPPRFMYLLSLFLLIITRFSLLWTNDYYPLLCVAIGLGVAKGVRTVYWSLVIPSYVPIERLAAALGIQMTVNGICIWIGGPVIGFIRDLTGSYRKCIFVINTVTFTTIVMWTIEMVYIKYKSRKTKNTQINIL